MTDQLDLLRNFSLTNELLANCKGLHFWKIALQNLWLIPITNRRWAKKEPNSLLISCWPDYWFYPTDYSAAGSLSVNFSGRLPATNCGCIMWWRISFLRNRDNCQLLIYPRHACLARLAFRRRWWILNLFISKLDKRKWCLQVCAAEKDLAFLLATY